MRVVHYIIPTIGIGGAEKRFIELWCYLQKNEQQFDLRLIISTQLYKAIKANDAIMEKLGPYKEKVNQYDIDPGIPTIAFQRELYRFVCDHSSPNDILHFILSYPTYIFPLKHSHTVYSLTESSLKNVNIKGKLLYMLNVCRSGQADILDPVVYKQVSRLLFFRKNKIHQTPGSFVDTDLFRPVPVTQKENWFVYLGRFFWIKQVLKLLEALPEINNRLIASGVNPGNYKFIFLGYGHQEEEVKAIAGRPEYKSIPVEIRKTGKPEEVLNKSKVIFSLQLRNNYPSKSLLEGMASGNIPLVTDVGSTRLMADPGFSYYVPEDFTAKDIADRLIEIISLDDSSLQQKINSERVFIAGNFSIRSSASYYTGLYLKL